MDGTVARKPYAICGHGQEDQFFFLSFPSAWLAGIYTPSLSQLWMVRAGSVLTMIDEGVFLMGWARLHRLSAYIGSCFIGMHGIAWRGIGDWLFFLRFEPFQPANAGGFMAAAGVAGVFFFISFGSFNFHGVSLFNIAVVSCALCDCHRRAWTRGYLIW